MDNCSIHKSNKIKELIEEAEYRLIFLPPYSPDLNPIENYWVVMKNQIKKIKNKFNHFIEAIDHVLIHNKNYFTS